MSYLDRINIDFDRDLFILPVDEYKRDIDPIGQYIEQQSQFLHIMEDISLEEAETFVKKTIGKEGKYPIINPMVTYVRKDEYGDRVKDRTSLLGYINSTLKENEVLTATFTTFVSQDKKLSYISEYVDHQIPKRKKLKKLQFQKKQEGDKVGEAFANNGQNNIKRSINSISGASSIVSTPIYMASMHPILTSTCRMTSGYANANNEKLLGGNRHYHNPDVTINNLCVLTYRINEDKIEKFLNDNNLYVPTAEELFEDILNSTRLYWRWSEKEQIILEFLKKCNREQRASIAFTYDMYLMRKYNPEFMKKFIIRLATNKVPDSDMTIADAKTIFSKAKESIRNIGIQINADLVKGLKEDQYVDTDTILKISSCIVNIYQTFELYSDYITTFLRSNHIPPSLAMFPNSLRKVVLMSDTDSSMFTTQGWTNWIVDETKDETLRFPVFANIVGLVDATLKHHLAIMSFNLGVSKKKWSLISMKNEFSFDTFASMGKTKHYIASINYQEGNVYNKISIEKKGVHLKNSNSPQEIINHGEDIMLRLYSIKERAERKLDNCSVKLTSILKEIADEERKIFRIVDQGDVEYYRSKQIKDEEAYKNDGENSPYAHYTFWNETFGHYYGFTAPPPYSAFDVKLSINNKTKMKEFLDSFENQELADKIRKNMERRGKDVLGTINIPYEVFVGKSIPKEIIPYVAKRELVANICSPYYIALEAVGMFFLDKNVTKLISDYY
jgi:hypothetical protein